MKRLMQRCIDFVKKPIHLMVINSILLVAIVISNFYFQSFCNPTPWAWVVIIITFLSTAVYPIFRNSRFEKYFSMVQGVSFVVFLYCVIFISWLNLYAIMVIPFGYGIIILTPLYLVIQIYYFFIKKPHNELSKKYFLKTLLFCFICVIFTGINYNLARKEVERFKNSGYTELKKTFMTEKILGMHFIYHTKIDMYDGWRPPLHEPRMVIGRWLNFGADPLHHLDLETRLELL